MASPVTITLAGAPQGKGRARAFVRGGHVGHYTPAKRGEIPTIDRKAAAGTHKGVGKPAGCLAQGKRCGLKTT
jgi:hypothetical protein